MKIIPYELIKEVAKAIEGPHKPVPEGSKFSLYHLREVRWSMLSESDKGCRLNEAQSALAYLHNTKET